MYVHNLLLCLGVCVCVLASYIISIYIHISIFIYVYICIHLCVRMYVCLFLCVCVYVHVCVCACVTDTDTLHQVILAVPMCSNRLLSWYKGCQNLKTEHRIHIFSNYMI